MDGDTAHTVDEFGDFPWERLDDQWFTSCGGYGEGGVHAGVNFNPCKPSIGLYPSEDLSQDRWEIPMQLRRLLEEYRQRGREELQQELRSLLNVPCDR